MTTTVYRLFDADGVLLYVGISGNPGRRFNEHSGDKAWWPQVARAEMEHFAEREEAEYEERIAIQYERPVHNVAMRAPDRAAEDLAGALDVTVATARTIIGRGAK